MASKIYVGPRLDWRFGWVCVNLSCGNRSSGHHWYFVGKISFLMLFTRNQKACSATISLTQYSMLQWIKKQKSSQRTKREDVSIILDNLLPEAHRTESRKPQYADREELHWRPEVQLTLCSEKDLEGLRGRDLLHKHAVLLEAALGLEPRSPISFYLSAQPELTVPSSLLITCSACSPWTKWKLCTGFHPALWILFLSSSPGQVHTFIQHYFGHF